MSGLALVDQLLVLRSERGIRLITKEARPGVVFVDRDPDDLVTELLRLARLGAVLEAAPDGGAYRIVRQEITARAASAQPFGARP